MPAQMLVRGASPLLGSDCPSLFIGPPKGAGASFGPDIPTCGRKENLTIPRSEDRGNGLLQAGRQGRTPRMRSSGILASAGLA
jgi:hypothetical protein